MHLILRLILCLFAFLSGSVAGAEEDAVPELTFEQRKAISELKARGGEILGYLRKDGEISVTLPKNFADADLALIESILDWKFTRLHVRDTKLSEGKLRDLFSRQNKLQGFEGNGKNLTDKGLAGLSQSPNLFFVKLTNTNVTASLFQQQGFAGFHSLQIDDQLWTADGFAKLANLDLWYLTISGQKIDTEILAQIAKLKTMRRLTIDECPVEKSAWQIIPNFVHLDYINLENTGITAEQLPLLQRLSKLRCLTISEEGITVEQLLPLAELPQLEELNCYHLKTKDYLRLDQLINEPRLRENARKGHLAGYAISEEQVKKLKLRQPVRNSYLDTESLEPETHWYPPQWLSEAWDKQPEPPVSEEHKDWFPAPRESK